MTPVQSTLPPNVKTPGWPIPSADLEIKANLLSPVTCVSWPAAGAHAFSLTLLGAASSPPRLLDGWLLKRKALYRPSTLASLTVRSSVGSLFWRKSYFALGALSLEYWATPEDRVAGRQALGVYPLDNVDAVFTQQQDVTLHFLVSQRTGSKNRERRTLSLRAASVGEAERWGAALKQNVARALGASLPYHWDIGAVLSDAAAPVRLVAEVRLNEATVTAMQRLVDHCLTCKLAEGQINEEVPVRMDIVQVIGVQNFSAWTKYGRTRGRVAAKCLIGQKSVLTEHADLQEGHVGFKDDTKLEPDVLTSTHGDPLVGTVIGQLDQASNERFLFHGTTAASVQGIVRGDFRLDLAGSRRETLDGKGLYLAESSSMADEYAEEDPEGICRMLLCRVALGRVLVDCGARPVGTEVFDRTVQEGYDSLCGDRWTTVETYREFFIYNQQQVYPAYIVLYRRRASANGANLITANSWNKAA